MNMQSIAWSLMTEEDYGQYIEDKSTMKRISTATIARELAVAIVNDDCSGLSGYDCDALDIWVSLLPPHYITCDSNQSPEFSKCEITGLMADCLNVDIWEA